MLIILALVVGAAVILWVHLSERDGDTPARIVTVATNQLPARRQEWGQAMVAELAQIHGRARRWRFTAGVLRVVLFPPVRHPKRALVVASVGLVVAAAATMTAAYTVPSVSVFAAVLSLLLAGCATVVTSRSSRPHPSAAAVIVSAVALAGVAATITATVWVAVAHPSATADDTHLYSILFAVVLTGYLAFTLASLRRAEHTNTVLWWAVAGALGSGAVWTVSALTTPATTAGVRAIVSPVGAAATLAASIGVSFTTRSGRAGARAGLLTAILGAPILFAVDITALLRQRQYILTNPYDIAAYPRSGQPDVASFILSDELGGHIIGGLVFSPILLTVLALLGAAAGAGLTRPPSADRAYQ